MESSAVESNFSQAVCPSNIHFEEAVGEAPHEKKTYLTLGEVGTAEKKGKAPRRLIHFSDGVLEEYSTEEEEEKEETDGPRVDPKSLRWLPWLWYNIVAFSFGALSVADVCGEKLAWFFGITSPKYQFAINEFERIQSEEKEEQELLEREKQAEKEREAQKMGDMEGALSSVYAPAAENQQPPTGTINPAYEPDSVTTEQGGQGEKF